MKSFTSEQTIRGGNFSASSKHDGDSCRVHRRLDRFNKIIGTFFFLLFVNTCFYSRKSIAVKQIFIVGKIGSTKDERYRRIASGRK